MAKMTKQQTQLLAGVLAVVVVYYFFLRKKPTTTSSVPLPVPNPQSGIVLESVKTYTVNTVKDPLNIRKSPSTTATKIGTLPKGSTFLGAKVKGSNWIEVYESDKKTVRGYVSSDYASTTSVSSGILSSGISIPVIPTTPSAPTLYNYVVKTSGSNLNVRLSPSTTAPIIAKLPNGTKFMGKDIPLGSGNPYFEAQLPNGKFGWIDSNYVQKL